MTRLKTLVVGYAPSIFNSFLYWPFLLFGQAVQLLFLWQKKFLTTWRKGKYAKAIFVELYSLLKLGNNIAKLLSAPALIENDFNPKTAFNSFPKIFYSLGNKEFTFAAMTSLLSFTRAMLLHKETSHQCQSQIYDAYNKQEYIRLVPQSAALLAIARFRYGGLQEIPNPFNGLRWINGGGSPAFTFSARPNSWLAYVNWILFLGNIVCSSYYAWAEDLNPSIETLSHIMIHLYHGRKADAYIEFKANFITHDPSYPIAEKTRNFLKGLLTISSAMQDSLCDQPSEWKGYLAITHRFKQIRKPIIQVPYISEIAPHPLLLSPSH